MTQSRLLMTMFCARALCQIRHYSSPLGRARPPRRARPGDRAGGAKRARSLHRAAGPVPVRCRRGSESAGCPSPRVQSAARCAGRSPPRPRPSIESTRGAGAASRCGCVERRGRAAAGSQLDATSRHCPAGQTSLARVGAPRATSERVLGRPWGDWSAARRFGGARIRRAAVGWLNNPHRSCKILFCAISPKKDALCPRLPNFDRGPSARSPPARPAVCYLVRSPQQDPPRPSL